MKRILRGMFVALLFAAALSAQQAPGNAEQQRQRRRSGTDATQRRTARTDNSESDASDIGQRRAARFRRRSNPEAEKALQQAHALTQQMSDDEKPEVLSRIAQAASRSADQEFAKGISEELYELGRNAPEASRDNLMSQAVMAMASVDPQRALDMLKAMPSPSESSSSGILGNRQEWAAMRVFDAVLSSEKENGLAMLREAAVQMSAEGRYPYGAMGSIMQRFAGSSPDVTEELFREALSAYRGSSRTIASDISFSNFLVYAIRMVPGPLAQAGMEAAVGNLLSYPTSGSTLTQTSLSNNKPDTGQMAQRQLLQLLRMSGDLGEEMKSKVIRERPELASSLGQASGFSGITGFSGNAISGPAAAPVFGRGRRGVGSSRATFAAAMSPEISAQVDRAAAFISSPGFYSGLLFSTSNPGFGSQEQYLASSVQNPDKALASAGSIKDDRKRAEALAVIAQSLSGKDRNRSGQAVSDAMDAATSIEDKREQLQALVTVAHAANGSQNTVILQRLLTLGFSLADKAVLQDKEENPDSRNGAGLRSLMQLTSLGMQADSELTLASLASISMPYAKAMLLVTAAESMEMQQYYRMNSRGPEGMQQSDRTTAPGSGLSRQRGPRSGRSAPQRAQE